MAFCKECKKEFKIPKYDSLDFCIYCKSPRVYFYTRSNLDIFKKFWENKERKKRFKTWKKELKTFRNFKRGRFKFALGFQDSKKWKDFKEELLLGQTFDWFEKV